MLFFVRYVTIKRECKRVCERMRFGNFIYTLHPHSGESHTLLKIYEATSLINVIYVVR